MADNHKIQSLGGGSLLIAWQLKDKRVLIVGGGEVASQRIESILHTDALITVVAPSQGLHPQAKKLIELRKDRIKYVDHAVKTEDLELDGIHMVLTALDDHALSHDIVSICRSNRIPVNAADIPELCDFYFNAQIRDGPLQIALSTNGNGPRMAALIRDKVQNALSGHEGDAITKVGILRNKLKERAPGVGGQVGRERMRWMTGVCNAWEMEDLATMNETTMENLLDEGWEKGRKIPTAKDMGIRPKNLAYLGWTVPLHVVPTTAAFALGAITATVLLTFRPRS